MLLTIVTLQQLREVLEEMDKTESERFERVGRRLNTTLGAIRDAKERGSLPLSEEITAFKQATIACKPRQRVALKLRDLATSE